MTNSSVCSSCIRPLPAETTSHTSVSKFTLTENGRTFDVFLMSGNYYCNACGQLVCQGRQSSEPAVLSQRRPKDPNVIADLDA